MVVKVFILGLPGSGKSAAGRRIVEYVNRQYRGYLAIRLNDYDILKEMFQADREHKQFRPREHDGFDVLEFSVCDKALKELQYRVELLPSVEELFVIVEFARNDYNEALKQFSRDFLRNAYFLFLDADVETCKQRIRERVAHPTTPDDHFVSEYIFESYYKTDSRQYMTFSLKSDKIGEKVKIISSNCTLQDFLKRVDQFVDFIFAQEIIECARFSPC